MATRTKWYEEQAARAPWSGTVNGRAAYIDRFKGKWEVCCRVDGKKGGVVMFPLANRAAIRNLAEAATPPLPEDLLAKALKGAVRDEPIRRPAGRRVLGTLLLLALLAAAAWAAWRFAR